MIALASPHHVGLKLKTSKGETISTMMSVSAVEGLEHVTKYAYEKISVLTFTVLVEQN